MKHTLEGDYKALLEIRERVIAAKQSGDEAGLDAAQEEFDRWEQELPHDPAYQNLFRLYRDARKVGNEYIDLHDVIRDKDVKGLVEAMRGYGIDHFTFSSGWSSAVETAWLLQKEGCILEGLVEINSQHQAFMSEEYEKAHGYLFRIG